MTRSPATRIEFVGGAGARLSGLFDRPDSDVKGSLLLAHCFTCSKDFTTTRRLAHGLNDAGYATFRFDFTGIGESGGSFADKTVSHNVSDVTRAAVTLIERGLGPCALVGHSLGGAAVLLAAHRIKTVRAVAVIGAPSDPGHVRRLLDGAEDRIRREGVAEVCIGGRPFPVSAAFLDDLDNHPLLERVAELDVPVLVLHAPNDDVVSFENGERIQAACPTCDLRPLVGSDHLLVAAGAIDRALTELVRFFDRVLGA
ncbi:MAG: alpha/beta hydrolase [Actinomycetia bacterium]|nr:alpha/beta hydrolase [Actinomycetes bacterium]